MSPRALEPLGVDFAASTGTACVEPTARSACQWGRTPVDLFFSYDPFHDAMAGGIRRVPFGDIMIPILGPEHLVVCKAMFDRPKDWLDIDAGPRRVWRGSMLERCGGGSIAMVGTDDQRRVRFDELAHDLLGR